VTELATLEVKRARAERPIQELLAARWSPYGFTDRAVAPETLAALFEAARWAPSSFNEQPWFFVVARREDPDDFARLLACLVEFNQSWAASAPVLAICGVRRQYRDREGRNPAAEHDLGLATANLMVEATARGLRVHAMIGIEAGVAREQLEIPAGLDPLTAIAVGYPGTSTQLAEKLRARDRAPRERRPVEAFVYAGRYGADPGFVPLRPSRDGE